MFKNTLIILAAVMICIGCQQEEQKKVTATEAKQTKKSEYQIEVEEAPTPVGGIQAIAEKIKYPAEAKQAGIQGSVFVKVFIDEEGNVVKTEVIKSVGYGLDEAATKAIEATKFVPGKHNGVAVKVQISIPVKFKLE